MREPGARLDGARAGAAMALASMSAVQLGAAAAVGLFDRIGAAGAAWLRLLWAAVVLLVVVRPWRGPLARPALVTCAVLGAATCGMTVLYMVAISRLALGTASALQFLGPLSVAITYGGRAARAWALVAAGGVLLLTTPWDGSADAAGVAIALAAAACWAGYIVLTQRAGDAVGGVRPLAISIPVAALAATVAVGPAVLGEITWQLLAAGLGLALLMPLLPFALELLALRRLTIAAFGTLMSLEPAIALGIGVVVLGQMPAATGAAGIVLVVVAGIGAERNGTRRQPVPDQVF